MKRRAFVRSGMGIAMGSVIPGVPRFLRVGWRDLPDVEAVTGDGKPVTLRGAAMEALAARMRGGSCSPTTTATTRPGGS
jgi:hypothetical protein